MIDRNECENTYAQVFNLFSIPERLSKPLEFESFNIEKAKQKCEFNYLPIVINFGPSGSGKSLACNYMLRESVGDNKLYSKNHVWFAHSTRTSEITIGSSNNLVMVDTVGFNTGENMEYINMIQIFNLLENFIQNLYLNGFIFTCMCPKSGRMLDSDIEILYQFMLGLTITYEQNCGCKLPFVKVLVTNFSKSPAEDSFKDSFMSRANSFAFSNGYSSEQENAKIAENTEAYIAYLKDLIVEKICNIQKLNESEAKKIVNQVLPNENFYFFNTNCDYDQKEIEKEEISKLYKDISDSTPLTISEKQSHLILKNDLKLDYFSPVVRVFQCIGSIVSFYHDRILTYKGIIEDYFEIYQAYCKENNEIKILESVGEIVQKTDNMLKYFESTIESDKRYVWMKFKRTYLIEIDEALKKFIAEIKSVILYDILANVYQNESALKINDFEKHFDNETNKIEKSHKKAIKHLAKESSLYSQEESNQIKESNSKNLENVQGIVDIIMKHRDKSNNDIKTDKSNYEIKTDKIDNKESNVYDIKEKYVYRTTMAETPKLENKGIIKCGLKNSKVSAFKKSNFDRYHSHNSVDMGMEPKIKALEEISHLGIKKMNSMAVGDITSKSNGRKAEIVKIDSLESQLGNRIAINTEETEFVPDSNREILLKRSFIDWLCCNKAKKYNKVLPHQGK